MQQVSFLYDDVIKNNFMLWVFAKKNPNSFTAKSIWKVLLLVTASQFYMTFSTFTIAV